METRISRGLVIKKQDLFYYFVMIAFFEPPLFSQISLIDNIWLIFKAIAALYVFSVFLRDRFKFSPIQILCCAFFGFLVVSTVLNEGDVWLAIRTVAFNLILCLFFDYKIRSDSYRSMEMLSNIMLTYMIINLFTLLLFPEGFGSYISDYTVTEDSRLCFLGRDNVYVYFFLLAITLTILTYGRKNFKTYIAVFLSLFSMLYVWSGTGLVCCVFFVIYFVFICGKKLERFFSPNVLSLIYLFCYLGIVIFRIQEYFSILIVDILHKDVTMTGRTYLWDTAITYIIRKPLYGYGIAEKMIERHGTMYSTHNLVLQILIAGGIVALVLFLLLYLISCIRLAKSRAVIKNVVMVSIFIYLMASLTEATMNTAYLYLLFILATNIDGISFDRELSVMED